MFYKTRTVRFATIWQIISQKHGVGTLNQQHVLGRGDYQFGIQIWKIPQLAGAGFPAKLMQ